MRNFAAVTRKDAKIPILRSVPRHGPLFRRRRRAEIWRMPPRGILNFPRRDVITARTRERERASHRFDDTRLIGADNLYAALIRRYFQVTLRRRSYAERARDGTRRVECNLAGNPWQCACTGYARTAAKRDCTTCRARVRVGWLRKNRNAPRHISVIPSSLIVDCQCR